MAAYSNQYSGYGGNPYGGGDDGGYGASNPYGGDGGNPYGGGYGQQSSNVQQSSMPQQQQPYANQSQHGQPQDSQLAPPGQQGQNVQYVRPGPSVMSNSDFLSRVEAVKADIRSLTTHIGEVGTAQQRALNSPDSSGSNAVESAVSQTQVLNTSIKDQIKFLETDAARSRGNSVKDTQVKQLKTSFQNQLQQYRVEENEFQHKYREQIARQYRIVNPEATDAEVAEATQADWGNEGVFQTALKSNRSATANTVLGAVRARHNDIQKIERTMLELNQLMEELATAVVLQEEAVQKTEDHSNTVKQDTEAGNQQLSKATDSARRARKLKWWCAGIVVLILVIIGLAVGLYFGVGAGASKAASGN